MKININNLQLTADAAKYMASLRLVMRNSFTEQAESLHYGRRNFPRTHTPGGGLYCTPLWTIGSPQFLKAIDDRRLTLLDGNLLNNYDFTDCDNNLAALNPTQLTHYLNAFVNKIKQFIKNDTSFGMNFNGFYNYELLIASSNFRYIDDLGRYPTGGRCHNAFHANSICYRATFNEIEIQFFKDIQIGKWDSLIFPNKTEVLDIPNDVKNTLRLTVCNQLATEIIASKLILFLNACGQLKSVVALSSNDLGLLLNNVVTVNEALNSQLVRNNAVSYVARDNYFNYLQAVKYTHNRSLNYILQPNPIIPTSRLKAANRCKEMVQTFHLQQSNYQQTKDLVENNYPYATTLPNHVKGRNYHFFTVSIAGYAQTGDALKTKLLFEFTQALLAAKEKGTVEDVFSQIKQKRTYKEGLAKGQGFFNRLFQRQTDSEKALENIKADIVSLNKT